MNTNVNDELGMTDPPEGTPPAPIVDPAEDEITPTIIGPPIKIIPVAIDDARTLLENYQSGAVTPVVPVKGVYLDRSQFEAMKKLLEQTPALNGFRILFGKEGSANVGLVLGVDERGADITRTIYKTASPKTGPCPPICDQSSPITTANAG